MKVPLSWLKEYVDVHIPVEELAYRLTLAGLEVSGLRYIGVAPGAMPPEKATPIIDEPLVWDREKLVVGHILEVRPHPDADKLVLAMIESGIGQVETCVTGAPNLMHLSGKGPLPKPLITAYAREGAEVIDGHKEDGSRMILKPRVLRGIENRTMVCSEKELGFWDDHGGIILFETKAKPGTPLADVLGDVVMQVELTPNMARSLSILGIAREVAALLGKKVRYPSFDLKGDGPRIDGQAAVEIRDAALNPRFTLSLIKGVTVKPSPEWMQRRLRLAGMRPINNIVDITNYVMLETGQPLHAFDYNILRGRAGGQTPTIITRLPQPSEKLTTLDGVERTLDPFTILVADTAGGLSLGGIMGGAESEINDATTDVLLESASWNLINIRRTLSAQRERGAEINSEAAARFSRGVHPAMAPRGLARAAHLMGTLGGGVIAAGSVDSYPHPLPEQVVSLPLKEVSRLLGVDIPKKDVINILKSLEFDVKAAGKELRVTVPDHRMDIGVAPADIEESVAQADLIEEIARIWGYDRIPDTMLIDELPPQRNNPGLAWEEFIRDTLAKLGLQEVITYRLTTPQAEARLTPPGAKSGWPTVGYTTLANPISAERTVMRHTLLSGMLDVLAANQRWRGRQALFEIGRVYLPVEDQPLPDEPLRLGLLLTGPRGAESWAGGGSGEPMDFYDLKGIVEALMEAAHARQVQVTPAEHTSYWPGRAADLHTAGARLGTFGQLHPKVAAAYGLGEQVVLAAELDLGELVEQLTGSYSVEPISNYPAVYQDIAVIVPETTPAGDIEAAIWQVGAPLVKSVKLFDIYRDEERLGKDRKSLAYALTYQAYDRTLKDKDAARIQEKIVETLAKQFNAQLRS